MAMLASHPKTLFVGQAIRYDGQRAHATFKDVPMEKRIEMPVCEDFQMGFCTGLALEGYIPISFFPRWDFLIIAANQLVNHLDKIPLLGGFRPKVIIRTAVGAKSPLDPGPQHTQNHSLAMLDMLKTIWVCQIFSAEQVMPSYRWALENSQPVIMVEHMDRY
jgi:pyruvate/2-oxoglutarate/acetoin dehydrogenase E1 component